MQEMNVKMKYNINYEISIRNDNIFIKFFSGQMFEPPILKKSMDKQLLFRYYCVIKFVIDISKEINRILEKKKYKLLVKKIKEIVAKL